MSAIGSHTTTLLANEPAICYITASVSGLSAGRASS